MALKKLAAILIIVAGVVVVFALPASAGRPKPKDSIVLNNVNPTYGDYATFDTYDRFTSLRQEPFLQIELRCTQGGVQVYENVQPQDVGPVENMAAFGLFSAEWDRTLPASCTADMLHYFQGEGVVDASVEFTVGPG